jgi:two-component system chemotaxis response regulator CheB
LRSNPDVVILDIEMPDMDGLTALPLLLQQNRNLVVIVASTLTSKNAEISLRCLHLGATDYIPKPSTNRDVTISADFRRELIAKVKALGLRARQTLFVQTQPRLRAVTDVAEPPPAVESARQAPLRSQHFTLRPPRSVKPRLIAIGASTGGPQAITKVVAGLKPLLTRMPIVITQHMPPTFTSMFADHLRRNLDIQASEAEDGALVLPGQVYVAAGAKHLSVHRVGTEYRSRLSDGPPVNFCRPSVDVLFASAAEAFGAATLGIILTGMGSDGARGAGMVAAAGGNIIAQDEASSVVWGMPGATARLGVCTAVLPLERISEAACHLADGGKP